jgi:hypothetical protein
MNEKIHQQPAALLASPTSYDMENKPKYLLLISNEIFAISSFSNFLIVPLS